MDFEFKCLFEQAHTSGCDKRQVIAGCYVQDHPRGLTFLTAANHCVHAGDRCPRLELGPGEGYDLCQAQHAEQNLIALMGRLGLRPAGDILWVAGHYYACEPCATAARKFGFREIRVRELPSAAVELPENDYGANADFEAGEGL